MADQAKIQVKFQAIGAKRLEHAIKQLHASQVLLKRGVTAYERELKRLNLQQRKYVSTAAFATTGNRLLSNSFATARSTMLLYSFAMSLGVRQTVQFAKQATKVQSMERAFNALSGGTSIASERLEKLQEATDGTMTKFDIFQQANNAMILGVSQNSDEMAEMFDMAQRLGEALGRDTKESVESLITGIGRQSKLMLDNIGIMVKVEDANKAYARELKKTTSQLTDAEKKQAFLNATLDAARSATANLAPEVMTAEKQFQKFDRAIFDAQMTIGEALLPTILLATRAANAFLGQLDVEEVRAYTLALSLAAGVFAAYRVGVKLATIQTITFSTILAKTPWGVLIALAGLAGGALLDYFNVLEPTADSQEIFNKLMGDGSDKTKGFTKEQEQGALQLQKQLELLNATNEAQRMRINLGHEASIVENDLINQIVNKKERLKEEKDALDIVRKANNRLIDVQILQLEANMAQLDSVRQTSDLSIDMLEQFDSAILLLQGDIENLKKGQIKAVNDEAKAVEDANQRKIQSHFKVASMTANAFAAIAAMDKKNQKQAQNLAFIAAMVDAVKGAQSAWAEAPTPFKGIAFAATLATGYAQAQMVKNAGGGATASTSIGTDGSSRQIIFGQPAPQYADGGLIGGRPHSQGGTMINAERGEFVMSRNAVDSIGLDTLNNLNQGGTAVTVNVSGNVMTQDFVDNDLADAIKDAVRRGSDFGLG